MEELPRKPRRQEARPYEAWEQAAKDLIEVEMKERPIGYKELARMLERMGIDESPDQINRKVNRQRFSAAFLLACLVAMGVETISLK